MPLTPQQAEEAKKRGLIDDETYSMIQPTPPPMMPEPSRVMPPSPMTSAEPVEPLSPKEIYSFDPQTTAAAEPVPFENFTPMDQKKPLATDYRMPSLDSMFDDSGYSAAIGKVEQGLMLKAAADQKYAEGEGQILKTLAENQEQLQKDQQLREIARQKQIEEKNRDLDDAIGQFEDADIDPSRLYTNASTAGKVMGAISLALGAFGASANGGENKAATIIRQAIDQDIGIQKSEIAKMGDMVSARRNLLQDMRLRFSDEREAETATKLAMIGQAELQIKALASQYKGPVAQAEAMKAIGALQIEREKLRAEFTKSAALANFRGKGQVPAELRDVYVPGYGIAPTKDEAKEMRSQVAVNEDAQQVIRDIKGMIGTGASLSPEKRAEANVRLKMLQGTIRELVVGPGTLSESDKEELEAVVANPAKFWSLDSRTAASLNALSRSLQQKIDKKAESLGMSRTGQIDFED